MNPQDKNESIEDLDPDPTDRGSGSPLERNGRKIGDIGWYTTARGNEMEVRLGEFLENGRVYLYCTTHAMGRAVDPEVVEWN